MQLHGRTEHLSETSTTQTYIRIKTPYEKTLRKKKKPDNLNGEYLNKYFKKDIHVANEHMTKAHFTDHWGSLNELHKVTPLQIHPSIPLW